MESSEADAFSDSCALPPSPESIFTQINTLFDSQAPADSSSLDNVLKSLDCYQELPQLLDGFLYDCIQKCSCFYLDTPGVPAWPCQIIYALAKIRGPKTVAKFFPSDVKYLLKLVNSLESAAPVSWQETYTLILWLSVSVLAPFPLATFGDAVYDRIYAIANRYLAVPGKERDAAALLMARLVTRQDAKAGGGLLQFLSGVKSGCVDKVSPNTVFYKLGALAAISHICKLLDANEVYLNFHVKTDLVVSFLLKQSEKSGAVHDKLVVKCLNKIGASLVLVDQDSQDYQDFQDSQELEISDPSELLELVFQFLTDTLQNPNSIVRYTAAKAVASITSTLPQEFQYHVLDLCLSTFDIPKTPAQEEAMLEAVPIDKWHGHLLLLAEMVRRKIKLFVVEDGCCDLSNFDALLSILKFTLRFEQQRLTRTLGAPIRDASCYVCWSLFRSSSLWIPQQGSETSLAVPHEFVQSLATALVCTACFDREINVRRAAAAALQEGIGRLPSSKEGVPAIHNGLALVISLDFSHVSVIEKAYTTVFPEVYSLGYTQCLDYLIAHTTQNSSCAVRKLAARAVTVLLQQELSKNVQSGTELAKRIVHEIASKRPTVSNLYAFHGVYYTVAQVLIDCGAECFQNGPHFELPLEIVGLITAQEIQYGDVEISQVFVHLFLGILKNEAYQNNTKFLQHACVLLQTLLKTDNPDARVLENQDLVDIARLLPINSIPNFSDFVVQAKREVDTTTVSTTGFKRSTSSLKPTPCNTCYFISYTKAIPKPMVLDLFYKPIVMPGSNFRNKQVATRCLWNAVADNLDLLLTQNSDGTTLDVSILQVFIDGLFDYTTDSRGDVGSWIRKTCIIAGRVVCKSRTRLVGLVSEKNMLYFCEKFDRFIQLYTDRCLCIAGELLDSLRHECVLSLAETRYPSIRQCFANFVEYVASNSTGKALSLFQYMFSNPTENLIVALHTDDSTHFQFVCSLIKGLISAAGAQQVSTDILESACVALVSILDPLANHFTQLDPGFCNKLWTFIASLVRFEPPTNVQIEFNKDILYTGSTFSSFQSFVNSLSLTTPRLALSTLRSIERVLNTGVSLPQTSFTDVSVRSLLSDRIIKITTIPVSALPHNSSLSAHKRALVSKLLVAIPTLLILSNLGDSRSLLRLLDLAKLSTPVFAQVREEALSALYDTLVISRQSVLEECEARVENLLGTAGDTANNDCLKLKLRHIWQSQIFQEDVEHVESTMDELISGNEENGEQLEQLEYFLKRLIA